MYGSIASHCIICSEFSCNGSVGRLSSLVRISLQSFASSRHFVLFIERGAFRIASRKEPGCNGNCDLYLSMPTLRSNDDKAGPRPDAGSCPYQGASNGVIHSKSGTPFVDTFHRVHRSIPIISLFRYPFLATRAVDGRKKRPFLGTSFSNKVP
ncbi:hypothetical protein P170DRAFT_201600 [Aspergillus steynii IBT 23096]|uniref:Uncharacterized protein n=1 Tax=Aspergillus steynii IBT 23096 TaxID=1392250 RepID=A0A2I2G510_9EURO|nr:uncharacterized protein P170DRAFT_201600 [Aspergillus steynii IBT 23096]PLB47957.1 hypothetical protein P170DRAFT_201600 [Aspergillus steynii IBT 23096]